MTQLNVMLLKNIGAAIFPPADLDPRPINERFQVVHEMLDVVHEEIFTEHPAALLESFLLLQKNDIPAQSSLSPIVSFLQSGKAYRGRIWLFQLL